MPESSQALLFDPTRNTHLVVEVGMQVAGYAVEAIAEDQVTLTGHNTQIVLTALPSLIPATPGAPPSASNTRPVRPSAPPAPPGPQPAPVDPYAGESVDWSESIGTAYSEALTDADAEDAGPKATPDPRPPTPNRAHRAPSSGTRTDVVISRTDVDHALEDFHALLGSIRGAFTNSGVRIEQVSDGSLFARAGLRVGDVVSGVDDRPLRTLDDTAELYARVSTARNVTVQVIRGGKPTTLHIAIGIVPR
ncbi:MAG: hypothetical protein H6Q90_790 [Deltaproteobacteria bacterium]|nr:hypothetical protein [Deltaproteobacteria bacterium]